MALPWEEDYGETTAATAEAPPWEQEFEGAETGNVKRDPVEAAAGDQLHQFEPPGLASRALEAAREYLSPILGPTKGQLMRDGPERWEGVGLIPQAAKPIIPIPRMGQQTNPPAHTVADGPDWGAVTDQGSLKPETGAALVNTLAGFAEFAESPLGMATLGVGKVAKPVVNRLIAGGYAADMASKVPEVAQEAGKASVEGSGQQQTEANLALAAQVVMPGALGAHALKPGGRAVNPEAAQLERELKTPNTKTQTPTPEPAPWEMEYAGGEMPRGTTKLVESPEVKVEPAEQPSQPSTPRLSTPSEPAPWELEYSGGEMPRQTELADRPAPPAQAKPIAPANRNGGDLTAVAPLSVEQWDIVNKPVEKGTLEGWADNVLAQDPRKRTRMGLDPVEESRRLAAVAIKGSYVIARGVRDFAQWSAEMIAQLPELAKAGEAELRKLYARAIDIAEGRDPEIGLSLRGMKLRANNELSEQVRENVDASYTKRVGATDIAEAQRLVTAAGGPERAAQDILTGLWKPVDLPVQVKGIGEVIGGLAKLERAAEADPNRANALADLQVRLADHSRQLATTPAQWLQSFNSLYANYSPLAWLKEWRNGIDSARRERVSRATGQPVGETPAEIAEGIARGVADEVRGDAPTAAEVTDAAYGRKTPNSKPETVTEAVERIIGHKGEQAKRTAKRIQDFYEREVEKFKRKHKIPELSPEDQRAILAEAKAIERLPADSLQRREAVLRLLDQLHRRKGFEWWELPIAFWYAHTLSGPTTHAKNILGNGVNLGMEAGLQSLLNPTNIPLILESLGRSLSIGGREALSILKTGHDTSARHGDKFELRRNPMELQNGAMDKILWPWKLVGRLLRAEDAVAFNAGQELRAAILSKRANGESTAAARRAMGWMPEARAQAEAQATAEGLTGLNLQRRVSEIIEQGRPETVMNPAREFGYDVTFNNEPYGVLGAFTSAINRGFDAAPLLKPFILPFTRIVANVSNSSLNWTPVGTYRALRAQGKFAWLGRAENNGRLFGRAINDPLAVRDQHARALLGTAAMIGVTAAAIKGVFDQNPQFMVTGSGPADKDQRNALRAAGWIPYSVKVGDRYYSYADKPPQLALAMVGHYLDAIRYKKLDQEDALNRFTYALNGSFGVLLQSSWLQGLSSLFNQANRDSVRSAGQGMVAQAARTGSGFVVPAALKQLDQFFDPQRYSAQDVQGMLISQVPWARRTGHPDLNVFGQPISAPTSKVFWSKVEGDKLVQRLAGQRVFPGSPAVGDLTPDEHYALVKYRGPILRELLATRADEWAGAPRLLAQDAVNAISAQATAQAKADLGLDEANRDRREVRKIKTR